MRESPETVALVCGLASGADQDGREVCAQVLRDQKGGGRMAQAMGGADVAREDCMKQAVVVGAGVIGSEIAKHLMYSGFDVRVVSHETLDVTKDWEVREYFDGVKLIDMLVNAFGTYGAIGPVDSVSPDEWQEAFRVNLFGVMSVCRYAIPKMRNGGHIINLAGGGATGPIENLSSYGCSKAAVWRLTQTLALECPHLHVNAISPGPIDRPMQDQILDAGERAGHWYEKILDLREAGEGAVPIDNTLAVIDELLREKPTGKLRFARLVGTHEVA